MSGLTPSQERALEVFTRTRRNIYLRGDAGSGKTFLLGKMQEILDRDKKKHLTLAQTGSAAAVAKGRTVARTFLGAPGIRSPRGWLSCRADLDRALQDDRVLRKFVKQADGSVEEDCTLEELDVLFLDEVSLFCSGVLAFVDHRLRVQRNCPSPFGGVRLVFTGDFGQLPPIPPRLGRSETGSSGMPCFHPYTPAEEDALERTPWRDARLVPLTLHEQVRAGGDPYFLRVAKAMRSGQRLSQWPEDVRAALLARSFDRTPPGMEDCTHCFFGNDAVQKHNAQKNAALPGEGLVTAEVTRSLSAFNCGERVPGSREDSVLLWKKVEALYSEVPWAGDGMQVKAGTKVMFTKNVDVDDGITNGATGVVIGLVRMKRKEGEEGPATPYLRVCMDATGEKFALAPVKETEWFEWSDGKWAPVDEDAGRLMSTRKELKAYVACLSWTYWPITFGWAVSYTKVQGRTLEAGAVLAVSEGLLPNMLYTGFTRCTSLARVALVPDRPFAKTSGATLIERAIKTRQDCLEFMRRLDEEESAGKGDEDRLQALREERRTALAGRTAPEEAPTCAVCMAATPDILTAPCNHVAMCERCNGEATRKGIKTCILCRGVVLERKRVFFA